MNPEQSKQLSDFKFALNESSIVAVTDQHGTIQYVNDKFCETSKYSREELIGQNHSLLNSGHHSEAFFKQLWATISSGKTWQGEIKNKAKDQSYYWVKTTIVPFLDEHGHPYQYLSIRNEVTDLKRMEEQLQGVMKRMLHIEEEERKRMSRELHDGIGQSMFSLLIQLDRIIGSQGNPELEKLRSTISDIMEDIRMLAWELRPSVLDDLGIVPAIRTYIENFTQHCGIKVHYESNFRKRLDIQTETAIYRIIQEALTNIGKYADVADAELKMIDHETSLEVKIIDHGTGFYRNHAGKGVGLFSMEERARSVGGQVSIRSHPGQGTEVQLILPIIREDNSDESL